MVCLDVSLRFGDVGHIAGLESKAQLDLGTSVPYNIYIYIYIFVSSQGVIHNRLARIHNF